MTDRIGVSHSSPYVSFYLECDRVSQDVAGNYTTLALYLRCVNGPGATTGTWSGYTGFQAGQIDGIGEFARHSGNPFLVSGLANGTQRWRDGPYYVNVGHGADGSRGGVTLRMILNYNNGEYVNLNYTADFNDFPTIPRASQPSLTVNPVNAGTATTINTNRASSGFTHDIYYEIGSIGTTLIASGVGASTSWTPPLSLLSEIPNSPTGAGTIRCNTFSGGTYLGQKTASFTLNTPSSVIPTWSSVSYSEAVSAVTTNVGVPVQGVSKFSHTITGAAGQYGASVPIQKFEVSGQTVNGATGTTPSPISSSGTVPLTWTIQDSRGRQKTQTTNVTVLPYTTPTVTSYSAVRCLSSGVVDPDNGTYLLVSVNAVVQSLLNGTQKNVMQIKTHARPLGSATPWGPGTLKDAYSVSGITYNASRTITGPFDLGASYEVRVEVIDLFNTSPNLTTVTTAGVFMHWGNGLGLGKYHQYGMLDVKGDIYTNDVRVEPAGIISMWSTNTAPGGWLICDGAAVSRTTYAALFAVIGTTYGTGNGTTTFNLPNLKGRVPVGRDAAQTEFDALSETGGAKTHALTVAEMPQHQHFLGRDGGNLAYSEAGGPVMYTAGFGVTRANGDLVSGQTGGNGAHNNLQPYIVLNYIIRV